jgi:L-threonylcarbamoyladenylate synthase
MVCFGVSSAPAKSSSHVEWNAWAEALACAFWPGPLTMVLKKKRWVSGDRRPVHELASAGGDTLAVRVPAHPMALQCLKAFDGPIAAPSANRSGRVSPTTAAHVREEFGNELPLIVDGGACDVGLESTVIDLSGHAPSILRPGAITAAMVARVLSPNEILVSEGKASNAEDGASALALKSPGLLVSHYAPSIPVRMNAHEVAAHEALLAFGPAPLKGAGEMLNLSERADLVEAAANLFAYLRALDKPRWRSIAVMPIPEEGVGIAINDRLIRASAPR